VLPLLNFLGLDSFWLAVAAYFLPALALAVPIIAYKAFHGLAAPWYEWIGFLIPGFFWGFLIMTSDYQLSLSAVSFYFGLLGWVPFTHHWMAEPFELDGPRQALPFMTLSLCLLALIAAFAAATGEWGPPIAIQDYVLRPDIIVF
jgi:hypothetical protein